jgi:fatty-acyl-CoA synthase
MMGDWFKKTTIGSLPAQAAAKFGTREALFFKGNRWTFDQLSETVDRAAKGLIRLGIQPGEKVSLWVPNRPEFIHLLFGLSKAGAVVVPVNTFFRTSDTAYVLKQSNTSTLITVDRSGPINYLSMVYEMFPSMKGSREKKISSTRFPDMKRVIVLSETPCDAAHLWPEVLEEGESVDDRLLQQRENGVDPNGTAFIMYTSGTTGFPKGVMHCHNVIRNTTDKANRLAITHQDVILMYLPLFHAFGLYEGPLMSMVTGARQILTERFDPMESIKLIEQERVTLMHGFDTHFKDILSALEQNPIDSGSLRTGLIGTGMQSSVPVARRVHKELCPGMVSAFGMTETGVGACLSFPTSTEEQRCEASGFPSPGYEIKIIDPDTGKTQPPDTPGEILIRGYMIMQGYYNKPEETAKAVDHEGWLHSGDMGLLRKDGHLRFIGRYKEMLKIGGENVDPMEVEAYLLSHPGVNQVAIVGCPDERLAEVGAAFVQLKPGESLTETDIIDYCKGRIASFKIPRHVIFVDSYPMTASGKIQKTKLKDQVLEQIQKKE